MDFRPLYALLGLTVLLVVAYLAYRHLRRERQRRWDAATKAHGARVAERWANRVR